VLDVLYVVEGFSWWKARSRPQSLDLSKSPYVLHVPDVV